MTYSTLMVHLELGQPNEGLLSVAAEFAERFQAGVLGVAVCQPMQINYGYGYGNGSLIEQDRDELAREIEQAEVAFRGAMQGRAAFVEWRAATIYTQLSEYLAHQARRADLILTGVDFSVHAEESRRADTGALVMQAGRPVLVVPSSMRAVKLDQVVVGWKDTRESRRAVADALPLLKHAGHVTIVEVVAEQDLVMARMHLADVAAWLGRHDVAANCLASASVGDDPARLTAIVEELNTDVLVAGAYGHSRVREWALGGVTRDLLKHPGRCAFLSH